MNLSRKIAILMAGLIALSIASPVYATEPTSEFSSISSETSSNSETQIPEVNTGAIELTTTDTVGTILPNMEFEVQNSTGQRINFVTNNGSYMQANNGYYSTITSDNFGKVKLTGMEPGIYTLIYTNNNTGYVLENNVKVNISSSGSAVTIQLTKNVGSLVFTLTGEDGTTVKDAKFVIKDSNGNNLCFSKDSNGNYTYAKSGSEALITNSAGKISANNIPVGDYTLVQTESPEEYNGELVSKKFSITVNGRANISATSTKEYGDITINVIDTNTSNSLSGSEFNITNSNGDKMYFTSSNGTYKFSRTEGSNVVKSNNGTISITGLPAGDYTLSEVTTPNGYLKTDNVSFNISKNGKTTLTIKNVKDVGSLKIIVKDATTKDNVGNYTFKITGNNNSICKFIKNSDGNYTYSTSGSEETVVSNANGEIIINNLPSGAYIVNQSKATAGYIIDTADIKQTINTQETTTYNVEVSKSNTSLTVLNEEDEPITGINVKILDRNGNTSFEGTTNENGKLLIVGIAAGSYTYQITEVPSPYCNKEYSGDFSIDEKGSTSNLEDCIIEYNKVTVDIMTELAGATFQLVDKNDNTKIYTTETDEKGIAVFSKIEDGEYTLTQIEAPEGYKVSELEELVIIDRNYSQSQTFKFENISLDSIIPSETISESNEDNRDDRQTFPLVPVALIIVLIIAVCAYSILKTKKQEEKENAVKKVEEPEVKNDILQFSEPEPIDSEEEEPIEEEPEIIKPDISVFGIDPYEQEELDNQQKAEEANDILKPETETMIDPYKQEENNQEEEISYVDSKNFNDKEIKEENNSEPYDELINSKEEKIEEPIENNAKNIPEFNNEITPSEETKETLEENISETEDELNPLNKEETKVENSPEICNETKTSNKEEIKSNKKTEPPKKTQKVVKQGTKKSTTKTPAKPSNKKNEGNKKGR